MPRETHKKVAMVKIPHTRACHEDVEEYNNSSKVYSLLEEGKALLETVFGFKLEYMDRKAKVAYK